MAERAPRRSFGEAIVDAWRAEGIRQRSRPPSVSTTAQLRELTRSARGQAAMTAAGVPFGRGARNLIAWIAGTRAPNPENVARIAAAYRRWFGPGFPRVTGRTHAIHGLVNIGGDERPRGDPHAPGRPPHAPLRIEGPGGRWDRIREAWNRKAGPGELGALFVADVIGVVLEISAASLPDFPGAAYLVTLE